MRTASANTLRCSVSRSDLPACFSYFLKEVSPKGYDDQKYLNSFSSVLGDLRKIAKSDYWLRHVCLSSVRIGTARLPLEGFS
jgi:hypothetical protein